MTATARRNLAGLDVGQIAEELAPLRPRSFVPGQLFRWIYARGAREFAPMTDLGRSLREGLERSYEIRFPEVEGRVPTADGTTRYVYRLADGERVESVFIPNQERQATLCLSSQVGCPLACAFCVSGLHGVKRNLSAGEIVGQALSILAAEPSLDRVNVVFMGMGEALLNFDSLVTAFRLLADPAALDIALRRMTVSTAGHVPAMERFGELPERPRLAVSLNATTDDVRTRIMPINRAWPLAELLDACRRFPVRRGERITFEYVLLGGVNDSLDDARRIPGLVRGIAAKVNLIPWNQAAGFAFRPPAEAQVDRFARAVADAGLTVTVRKRRGAEAGAACGQLATQRAAEGGVPVVP